MLPRKTGPSWAIFDYLTITASRCEVFVACRSGRALERDPDQKGVAMPLEEVEARGAKIASVRFASELTEWRFLLDSCTGQLFDRAFVFSGMNFVSFRLR